MPIKRWNMRSQAETAAEQAAAALLQKENGLSALAAQLLVGRGCDTQEKAASFLKGVALTDPMRLRDMDLAVARIHRALDEGERIAIYGDYDCDGILATVLLYRYFEAVGADICYYIPRRDSEGYGLNRDAVARIQKEKVSLIITVDNGVTAIEEIDYANELGLDVIVTDHHKPREILPNAVAVIDPHRVDDESGCEYLAGVGVAFKLVCALEENDGDWMLEQYGDLVAIATIADIVPLIGENRLIVQQGLSRLRETENEGLAALMRACKLEAATIRCENVTYGIVPRINSAGRFDRVDDAIELLVGESGEQEALAEQICSLNEKRRKIEDAICAQILGQLESQPEALDDRVLVVCGENWHHGVVGIVAARLVERFSKPCVVLSKEGDEARGSARSITGFSIIDGFVACADLLTRFGGHNQAAGLTLPSGKIDAFMERINCWAVEQYPEMPQRALLLDCRLTPQRLTVEAIESLAVLEPFGTGNETPLFLLENCLLTGIYPLGEGKHLRLKMLLDDSPVYAVYFGVSPQNFLYAIGDRLDLAVTVDVGEWNGSKRVSVKVKDVRMAGVDYVALHSSEQLYQRLKREAATEQTAQEIPDREDIAALYRYLRAQDGSNLPDELLFFRLGGKLSSLCKMKIAIDVLDEMHLITSQPSAVTHLLTLVPNPEKVDINQSRILQKLR